MQIASIFYRLTGILWSATIVFGVSSVQAYTPPTANSPIVSIVDDVGGSKRITIVATYTAGSSTATDFGLEYSVDGASPMTVVYLTTPIIATLTYSFTISGVGMHTIQADCAVSDNGRSSWNFSPKTALTSFTVISVYVPPVANIPIVSIVDDAGGSKRITIYATYTGGSSTATDFGLEYSVDGANPMTAVYSTTLAAATLTYSFIFPTAGTHTIQADCAVTDNNRASWNFSAKTALTSFTLSASNRPPDGAFDGVNDSTPNQGDIITFVGWAADPESGASGISRVKLVVDDRYVLTDTLIPSGSRPDVAQQFNRPDYLNSAWAFTFNTSSSVETRHYNDLFSLDRLLKLGAHNVKAYAIDSQGLASFIGEKNFTIHGNFEILIDTNELQAPETVGDFSRLIPDGVWILRHNSDSQHVVDAHLNPALAILDNQWSAILHQLGSNQFAISEDDPNSTFEASTAPTYIGKQLDATYFYHEPAADKYTGPNGTTYTPAEIDQKAGTFGPRIVVNTRSYNTIYTNDAGDMSGDYVYAALGNSNCAGVAFESNPEPSNPFHHGGIWTNDIFHGIRDCVAPTGETVYYRKAIRVNGIVVRYDVLGWQKEAGRQVKKCFILLPPRNNLITYKSDIIGAMEYLNSSGQLGNPNVYIVLANYQRYDTESGAGSHVGFVTGDQGTGPDNSILTAFEALKIIRNGLGDSQYHDFD